MTPGEALDFFRRLSCNGVYSDGTRKAKQIRFTLIAAYESGDPHPDSADTYNANLDAALAAMTRAMGALHDTHNAVETALRDE